MFRHIARPLATTAPRSIIAPAPAPAPRSFSALAPKMAEGDTGAPKQGGAAQGYGSFPLDMCSVQCAMYSGRANKDSDAFTKREAAQENFYIHEKEMEKYVITVSRVFCSLS